MERLRTSYFIYVEESVGKSFKYAYVLRINGENMNTTEILNKGDEMVEGVTYEMHRIKLTHLWGAVKMESIGMRHSSSNKRGGYRATAEAKHLFGWPQNQTKKETFRCIDQLHKNVVKGNYDGLFWEYPIPILKKGD